LVNWSLVCRLKDLGGLGIHDLNHFGRALRQRWFWYWWTDDAKSWQGLSLPCHDEDRALFQASTKIKLRNGKKASFWHDKWLNGIALKDQAPNLFKRTHFKSRTVAKELLNKNWIIAVRRISSVELVEFIKLWSLLKNVCLRLHSLKMEY
jgi:hypothetical protein